MPDDHGSDDALRWPDGFPPEDRWKRFFIGVRRLGPGLSFFQKLADRQAARTPDLLERWGRDPRRRRAAEVLGRAFQRHLGWATPFFSPLDEFRAVASGPRYSPVDHGDLESVVEEAERNLDGRAPDEFWAEAQGMTLGELVDGYLELSQARQETRERCTATNRGQASAGMWELGRHEFARVPGRIPGVASMLRPAQRTGGWWRPSALTLPVTLALLWLGLQHLFLYYMVIFYVPLGHREAPWGWDLAEIWWQSEAHGAGIPAELAAVNTLFAVYLWVSYRGQRGRWWERSGALPLVGLGLLFLASQYALYRLLPLPVVEYSVEVIRLSP